MQGNGRVCAARALRSLALCLALLGPSRPSLGSDSGDLQGASLSPRVAKTWCGTYPGRAEDEKTLHRINAERRLGGLTRAAAALNADIGNIAVIEDDGAIVAPANKFDLVTGAKLLFTPAGDSGFTVSRGGVRFQTGGHKLSGYVGGGADLGVPSDDGYAEVPFGSGFTFSFYGKAYDRVFVGTNGFITFGSGDFNSPAFVSLNAFAIRQPRIAAFWTDLDVTHAGIFVKQAPRRFVITWRRVPLYGQAGSNTFQVQLFPDGRLAFLYRGMTDAPELIGLSPGGGLAEPLQVDLSHPDRSPVVGAPFERFTDLTEVDLLALAQAFYRTHGDDYDFLQIWTDFRTDLSNAFAYEVPVRNNIRGIGLPLFDDSALYGSAGRLQSVLRLNRPGVYPNDPGQIFLGLNSALSIFAQEQGHRWMAFVHFLDSGQPSEGLLGRDLAHWSFDFNTESTISARGNRHSSSMEGNVIAAEGSGAFGTVESSVNYYSELDQYLMGFRGPDEVSDTFLVIDPGVDPKRSPQSGVTIIGSRKTIRLVDIIAAEGPRDPAYPDAQKDFRAAWVLLVQQGTSPSTVTLNKLETFRSAWEAYFNKAIEGRGSLSTSLLPPGQVSDP